MVYCLVRSKSVREVIYKSDILAQCVMCTSLMHEITNVWNEVILDEELCE